MRRILALARLALGVALCLPAPAASIRLHLTDGTHHVVREYEVLSDRVKFYSVERGEWEEIPLDLVDLKKTKAETAARDASRDETRAAEAAERKAEREMAREIANVPAEAGGYWIAPDGPKALKMAESKVVNNKRRSILKVMTPIPIVAGKSTLELDGAGAAFALAGPRPEFYFRMAKEEERVAIVKLKLVKGNRVVETWSLIPVSNELIQEREEVPTFKHQVGDNLYKLWPQKPIEPGEYALIEFTEGKGDTRVWDFRVQ